MAVKEAEPKPETAISFANITANKSTITSVSQHRRITRSASKPHQFDQPTTISVGRSADMSITIPDTDQALSSACDVVNLTGEDLLTDQNGWKEVEGKKKKNKRNTGKGPADQPQSDGYGPTSPNVKNCDTESIISAVKSAKPRKPQVLIGTAEAKTDCGLTGAKKAWFHIGLHRPIVIISVYRSPDGDSEQFLQLLDNCLESLSLKNKAIILCGDFNIHLETTSKEEAAFTNLLRCHNIFIANRKPTRGSVCLDTFATNLDQWDFDVSVENPLIADHCAVVFKLKARSAMFNEFFPLIPTGAPKPKVTLRPAARSSGKKWFTDELKHLKLHVLMLHDLSKKATLASVKTILDTQYRKYFKIYRGKLKAAKIAQNVSYIDSAPNRCKAAWQVINQNKVKSQQFSYPGSPDDFNTFFIKSVEDIVSKFPQAADVSLDLGFLPTPNCTLMEWEEVSPKLITALVKNFRSSKSQDVYGMSGEVLKSVIDAIADPLCKAINCCLRFGVFPDYMKISRTIPIYKKGDHQELANYRPISIIPVLAKVMESVMKIQLVKYFEENNLFMAGQHGFRRCHSTTTAILSLVEQITKAFEEGESMALTLCDLSRAFDCVSHQLLLQKLSHYGIGSTVHKTLASYLLHRKQAVFLEGAQSGILLVKHGVPQGSVLGPLLFLILVNDLELEGRSLLFADDSTLTTRGKDLNRVRQDAIMLLDRAKQWFEVNHLQLNPDKTQHLICTLKRDIGSQTNDNVKLLGFYLDRRMTWTAHVSQVCVKLSRVLCLLRKLRNQVTEPYLQTAYHAIFQSHIIYGLILWGHSGACEDVLKLQKKAVRIITSSGYLEHCRPIFIRLNILTVYSQYVYNSILQVREQSFSIPSRSDIHGYDTRRARDLNIARCRLSGTLRSFPRYGQKLFNLLPISVRHLEHAKFKSALHEELIRRPLYSLKELEEKPLFG
ncbi:uncharacterized protein LOC124363493 [Homalodisca vitripennis]|uniref:uncharacterized protein LOC124363493 n=1 Tax=Homalodisca vitripennis TaxID=197043 RepID=UPI001EEA6118|nr:uncharacterized protein LOC124363493 [Homalodisca vitripennis]